MLVRDLAPAVAVSAAGAALSGAIAGFVWGGLGGRLAMRVLVITSDDSVRGLTSDDGFTIGRISAASVFLLVSMTVLGGLLGAGYGLLRMLLQGPTWLIASGLAVALGAGAGGGLIVSSEGIDFRVLGPLWLAVGLFVALPAAWGATVVLVSERILHHHAFGTAELRSLDVRPLGRFGDLLGWGAIIAVTAYGLFDLAVDVRRLLKIP